MLLNLIKFKMSKKRRPGACHLKCRYVACSPITSISTILDVYHLHLNIIVLLHLHPKVALTNKQHKMLSVCPHYTASLSIIGSLMIIFEVLSDGRKRGKVSVVSAALQALAYSHVCFILKSSLQLVLSFITG